MESKEYFNIVELRTDVHHVYEESSVRYFEQVLGKVNTGL